MTAQMLPHRPFAIFAVAALLGAAPAIAVEGGQIRDPSPETLQRLEEDARIRQEEALRLEEEARRLERETAGLRDQLIQLANTVQQSEVTVIDAENRLDALQREEIVLTEALRSRREALIETLAALQVLEREPPPALLVHPDDAAGAVRSALLLSDIVPSLKSEADNLASQLVQLRILRAAIIDQRSKIALDEEALTSERKRLRVLIAEKQKAYATILHKATIESRVAARVGEQAASLKRIIDSLEERAAQFVPRPKPAGELLIREAYRAPRVKPGYQPDLGRMLAQVAVLPIRPDGRPLPFSDARGAVRLPVNGRVSELFGVPLDSGGKSKGIKLETRASAQVVAPFDGEVVAAGPYKEFGHVLIIEVAGGYHLLLAGMQEVFSDVGRRIAAGEPVGLMGEYGFRALSAPRLGPPTLEAGLEVGNAGPVGLGPVLYVEFRSKGEPFDPLPWFAARDEKVNG